MLAKNSKFGARKIRGNFRLHPVAKSLTGSQIPERPVNRNFRSFTGL